MTVNLLSKNAVSSNTSSNTSLNASLSADLDVDTVSEAGVLRPQFWTRFALTELTHSEWEALCDGCGSCCLIKFMDDGDDEEEVEYTDVACKLMDCATGYCQQYESRQHYVPDCIQLTADKLPTMMWLPKHCAYKRLYKGQTLPDWHLLLTKDALATQLQMRAANVGIAGRCVSETGVSDEEMEERVVHWVSP